MDDVDLLAGLSAGDERAMNEFVGRYRSALERIAGGAIAPGLRTRISPDSVAQSVCRTFLRRMDTNPFVLQDGGALWSLLCAIAFTKVRERVRFHRRERRNTELEVPLDSAQEIADPTAGPGESAALQDALDQVFAEFDSEERRILMLRLDGKTQEAIAVEVGCSERTVRRRLKALDERLRRRLDR